MAILITRTVKLNLQMNNYNFNQHRHNFARWTSGTTLSTSSSLFYDANYGGAGPNVVSTDNIYISRGSTTSNIYFGNTTTGTASLNGFGVGILSTGVAQIRQFENLALETYTNNTKVMSISGSASFGYGKYHDLFRVNETQWAPWEWRKTFTGTGAGGEVWSQTTNGTTTVPKSARVGRVVLGTQSNSTVTGTYEVHTTGNGSIGRISVPLNTILFYEIKAMCYQGVSVGYQIKTGSVRHSTGSLIDIGTATTTTITAFPANTSWATLAELSNQCLKITVTTTAALNVRWLFVVDYYEIGI